MAGFVNPYAANNHDKKKDDGYWDMIKDVEEQLERNIYEKNRNTCDFCRRYTQPFTRDGVELICPRRLKQDTKETEEEKRNVPVRLCPWYNEFEKILWQGPKKIQLTKEEKKILNAMIKDKHRRVELLKAWEELKEEQERLNRKFLRTYNQNNFTPRRPMGSSKYPVRRQGRSYTRSNQNNQGGGGGKRKKKISSIYRMGNCSTDHEDFASVPLSGGRRRRRRSRRRRQRKTRRKHSKSRKARRTVRRRRRRRR